MELKEVIADAQPGKIILCGELMKHLWRAIEEDPDFKHIKKAWYLSAEDILVDIDAWIDDDDHVVLKASNSMGLNKIVEFLEE